MCSKTTLAMLYGISRRLHTSTMTSTASKSHAPGTYVDNPLNRWLGRVGKPYGSHVLHNDGSVTVLSTGDPRGNKNPTAAPQTGTTVHVDLRPAPTGSYVPYKNETVTSCATYVDNPMNRALGRVVGSHVLHKDGTVTITPGAVRTYVDNPLNRGLGRVGKPIGSHVLHNDGSLTVLPITRESGMTTEGPTAPNSTAPNSTVVTETPLQVRTFWPPCMRASKHSI